MEEKEPFEWSHTWFDHTDKKDLPRILLVGDSICYSYQEKVRKLLEGVCYVDYYATSYAVNLSIYHTFMEAYVKDVHYDLIHFNNGLHGQYISNDTYESNLDKIVNLLVNNAKKVILAESTLVKTENNVDVLEELYEKVINKNATLNKVANKYGLLVNHLYKLSVDMPNFKRAADGWHYNDLGADVFADEIATLIKDNLK